MSGPVTRIGAVMEAQPETDPHAHIPTLEIIRSCCASATSLKAAAEAVTLQLQLPSSSSSSSTSSSSAPDRTPRPIIAADPLLQSNHRALLQNTPFVHKMLEDDAEGSVVCGQALEVYFFCKCLRELLHCVTPLLMHDINHVIRNSFKRYSEGLQSELRTVLDPHLTRYSTPGKVRTFRVKRSRTGRDLPEGGRMAEHLIFGGEVHGLPFSNDTGEAPSCEYYFGGLSCTPSTAAQAEGEQPFQVRAKLRAAHSVIFTKLPTLLNWNLRIFHLRRYTMKDESSEEEPEAIEHLQGLQHARVGVDWWIHRAVALEKQLTRLLVQHRHLLEHGTIA